MKNGARIHADVQKKLQQFARSTKIEVNRNNGRLSLHGTDLAHHKADPHLDKNLNTFAFPIDIENYAECHVSLTKYDFCLEDSWSGYFVAKQIERGCEGESIVFIHLDDHTDMMSTLLLMHEGVLIDPHSNSIFDPSDTRDWVNSIKGGAVGIGSFVTALYFLKQSFHVLHLNHTNESSSQLAIRPKRITHPLLPRARFASLDKDTEKSSKPIGTYSAAKTATKLLRDIPKGRVIVHIDLDYFINDYNGNIGSVPEGTEKTRRKNALSLINDFFDRLEMEEIKVERFIIASSPGFCSSAHWGWLLEEVNKRIT